MARVGDDPREAYLCAQICILGAEASVRALARHDPVGAHRVVVGMRMLLWGLTGRDPLGDAPAAAAAEPASSEEP